MAYKKITAVLDDKASLVGRKNTTGAFGIARINKSLHQQRQQLNSRRK